MWLGVCFFLGGAPRPTHGGHSSTTAPDELIYNQIYRLLLLVLSMPLRGMSSIYEIPTRHLTYSVGPTRTQ